jgi:hypothetical protein
MFFIATFHFLCCNAFFLTKEGLTWKEKNKHYWIFTLLTFPIKSRIPSLFFPVSRIRNLRWKKRNNQEKNEFEASTQALHNYSITLSLLRLDSPLASFLVLIVCCFCLVVVGALFFLGIAKHKKQKMKGSTMLLWKKNMIIGQWSIVHNDEGWLLYFDKLWTHTDIRYSYSVQWQSEQVDVCICRTYLHMPTLTSPVDTGLHTACTDASNVRVNKNCIRKQVSLYALIGLHADVWTVNISKECKRTHWRMQRWRRCVRQSWCT